MSPMSSRHYVVPDPAREGSRGALIVEIRPGEGGEDAEAFAGTLAQSVVAYVRRRGGEATVTPGRTTTVSIVPPERLRAELQSELSRFAGVHRIQRIPRNERSGRRHTSTATVAVLDANGVPELVALDEADLEIKTKRGTGKGGQHRNVTDSAVRLVHRPTGTVVEVNHGRSQWQNIATARAELERRLTECATRGHIEERNAARTAQIASGERPVKAFTWNDQRGEVIDHATGTRYPMQALLRGRLEIALVS